jgi:hypothetical protein
MDVRTTSTSALSLVASLRSGHTALISDDDALSSIDLGLGGRRANSGDGGANGGRRHNGQSERSGTAAQTTPATTTIGAKRRRVPATEKGPVAP